MRFFQQFRIFSSLSGFQYELLPYLAQKFRHSRQKCFLCVQTKIWWKLGFRLESVTVSNKIRTLTKICRTFGEKFRHVRQGSVFLIRGLVLKKNNCFKKNMFRLSLWDLEWRAKKNWLLTIFCPHCCRNFILSLQNNNLTFLEQFLSSYPFWDPSKNCLDILGKNFGTFVEAAFYVYRQTIWGETIFSKEHSSSYLFVTWRGKYLTSDNLVSALLTRLRFSVLELIFEVFFLHFYIFLSFLGF